MNEDYILNYCYNRRVYLDDAQETGASLLDVHTVKI